MTPSRSAQGLIESSSRPSASIALRLAESPARLSADYRFRVAGDARPGSGAALTLSAGF